MFYREARGNGSPLSRGRHRTHGNVLSSTARLRLRRDACQCQHRMQQQIAPAARSACVASSSSLTDASLHGTKIITAGITVANCRHRDHAGDAATTHFLRSRLGRSQRGGEHGRFLAPDLRGRCLPCGGCDLRDGGLDCRMQAVRYDSELRTSTVAKIAGDDIAGRLSTLISPMVPTAFGPWSRAAFSTARTTSEKAASASLRNGIGVVPAWLAKPAIVPSYHMMPWPRSTTPIVLFSASSSGPCSMCSSTKALNLCVPTGSAPR